MDKFHVKAFSVFSAFVLAITMIIPAMASGNGQQSVTWVPENQKGGKVILVSSVHATLGKKLAPTNGGIQPNYTLSSLGTGDTWLYQQVGDSCNGHEGKGKGDTYVNDNSNYNPEYLGNLQYNSTILESNGSSNEEHFFNESSWEGSFHCASASGNWYTNSTHKIWQVTLGVHNLSDSENYYTNGSF